MIERRKSYYIRLALLRIENKYKLKTSFFEEIDAESFNIIYRVSLGNKIIKINEKQFDTVSDILEIIKKDAI